MAAPRAAASGSTFSRQRGRGGILRARAKPWSATLCCDGKGRGKSLGFYATELAAAEAYAAAYEERHGTARRDDDLVDFSAWRSVWHHLVDSMGGDVDQMAVDVFIESLSNLPGFWNLLAVQAWQQSLRQQTDPASPSPEEIESIVLERTPDQIMDILVRLLWKDKDTYTAGAAGELLCLLLAVSWSSLLELATWHEPRAGTTTAQPTMFASTGVHVDSPSRRRGDGAIAPS